MNNAWEIPALVTASVLAIGLALIVIGGVKRIANLLRWWYRVMAAGYILIAFTRGISQYRYGPHSDQVNYQ